MQITRTVAINGRRTSVRLETAFWAALDGICGREGLTVATLCERLETRRGNTSRAAALRTFVVAYLGDRDS